MEMVICEMKQQQRRECEDNTLTDNLLLYNFTKVS